MRRIMLAGCAMVALAACGDDGDAASTTSPRTTAPAPSTTEATTTTSATTTTTTTTTPATTTTEPAALVSAVVWESAVDASRVNQTDPIPTQTIDGVTVHLQLVMYGPAKGAGQFSADCADEIGDGPETDCLLVQLTMDVDAAFRVDTNSPEASVSVDAAITSDGQQIESIWSESGYPGTRGTSLVVMLPGGKPGSTLKIATGSNLVGWSVMTFALPAEFLPAPWAA